MHMNVTQPLIGYTVRYGLANQKLCYISIFKSLRKIQRIFGVYGPGASMHRHEKTQNRPLEVKLYHAELHCRQSHKHSSMN